MEQQSLYTAHSLQGIILIKDSLQADGAFLIPHSMHAALQEGTQVVLVTLANTMAHYQHVLRKLGTNLPACMESKRVSVVEALPHAEALPEDAYEQLLDTVQDKVKDLADSSSAETCLILDSLSALRCMQGGDTCAWRRFVHRCSLLACCGRKGVACVIGLIHADVEDDGQWVPYLEHAAQVVMEVEALETGQALDITGRLAVVRRGAPQTAALPSSEPIRRLLNYKVTDAGVRIMQCQVR